MVWSSIGLCPALEVGFEPEACGQCEPTHLHGWPLRGREQVCWSWWVYFFGRFLTKVFVFLLLLSDFNFCTTARLSVASACAIFYLIILEVSRRDIIWDHSCPNKGLNRSICFSKRIWSVYQVYRINLSKIWSWIFKKKIWL